MENPPRPRVRVHVLGFIAVEAEKTDVIIGLNGHAVKLTARILCHRHPRNRGRGEVRAKAVAASDCQQVRVHVMGFDNISLPFLMYL